MFRANIDTKGDVPVFEWKIRFREISWKRHMLHPPNSVRFDVAVDTAKAGGLKKIQLNPRYINGLIYIREK